MILLQQVSGVERLLAVQLRLRTVLPALVEVHCASRVNKGPSGKRRTQEECQNYEEDDQRGIPQLTNATSALSDMPLISRT